MKKFYAFIYYISFIISLQAQPTLKDSVQLSELVVTGSKTEISRRIVPLSVSQISQTDIERTGQINILPSLNTFAPGIFVTERNVLGFGVAAGGSGGISMRGIGGSPNTQVLVLMDGQPQYQGIFGHPLSDAYVASDVEKVEIIHGPASILYGSNAMGGVVNIITKKQHREGLKASLGASYGSYNTQKLYGTIGYKKDKLNFFASANHDQTDGIRPNTDFNITNGYTKVGYEWSKKLSLTADVSIANYNANDNGSIYLALPAPFNIDILRGKASVSLDNKFEKSEGSLKMYNNFGKHDLSDGFKSTDFNRGLMLYQTLNWTSATTLTVGSDLKQYGGKVNQTAFKDSLLTVNEFAVYLYAQQKIVSNLTFSAGLRFENNSKYGEEFIPMGGLTYLMNDKTSFKASISKGFRSPTVMELYLYAPNADLQPERLMNYEMSWLQSFLNNKLNMQLTVFKIDGENLIQVVPVPVPPKRQNVGSFSNQGVEFSARYKITKNLHFAANYSYLDLKKAVVAAPRQQLNISANYHYKIWNLNVATQYIEKLYTFISPIPTISKVIQPNYFLLNARLSCHPLKSLELFMSGNNLLNQRYQINYGYPMPGINFNAGANYRF